MSQQIEMIFDNGVFRPLQPVNLPDQQRVTLHLPDAKDDCAGGAIDARTTKGADDAVGEEGELSNEEIPYQPLPLRDVKTIQVQIRNLGRLAPLRSPPV